MAFTAPEIPMYRVWCTSTTETETDAKEYGAIHNRAAAEIHCRYHFKELEANNFPLTFRVRNTTTNKLSDVVVQRVLVPEFLSLYMTEIEEEKT